ncbi:hypothetical protein BDU57DRAFT_508197 [Ampelomyces quisqualis]|uniref:Uncharacterized protein n=1 Tax=Ampelomyces quisqualis TaxID=50730 RepID=A0A6A5QXD5_AMPQU|nr:hypothetical protein BDU57DRAFT_508197 [Ampelomyces quisqualis]
MNETGVSIFFRLPLEPRDRVYHFLWVDLADLAVPYLGMRCLLRYGRSNKIPPADLHDILVPSMPLPHWLFISKAILAEGLALLRDRGELVIAADESARTRSWTTTLFGPGSVQFVTLYYVDTELCVDGSIMYPVRSMAKDKKVVHTRIAKEMAKRGACRKLHIWFETSSGSDRYRFDLKKSYIDHLVHYQRADITNLVVYVCNRRSSVRESHNDWVRTVAGLVLNADQPAVKREEHYEDDQREWRDTYGWTDIRGLESSQLRECPLATGFRYQFEKLSTSLSRV